MDVTVASVRTIFNVYNAYDCQSTCAAASDCFFFVYDKTVFYCYHKVNAFSAGYNTKFTSGPKVCPDSEFILKLSVRHYITKLLGLSLLLYLPTCSYSWSSG